MKLRPKKETQGRRSDKSHYRDMRLPPLERFMLRVNESDGHWLWKGHLSSKGYGFFCVDKVNTFAHRWAYMLLVGEVPEGVEVDHECLVRSCVNPGHLRLATSSENSQHREGGNQGATSRFRGVYWDRKSRKWRASASRSNPPERITSLHEVEEVAAEAAIAARMELFTRNSLDRKGAMQ